MRVETARRIAGWGLVAIAVVAGVSCGDQGDPVAQLSGETAQAAERGRDLMSDLPCVSCHVIPGVPEAEGQMGPPLLFYGQRPYIAGNTELPNTHDNLVAWLMDPASFEPNTDMPDLNLTREQASDIATYLRAIEGGPPDTGSPTP